MILGLYCISQPVSVNHKLLWLKCQETSSPNSSYLTEQQNVPERQNSEGSVSQSRWWLNKQGAQAVTKTSPLPPSSQMFSEEISANTLRSKLYLFMNMQLL